MTAQETGTTVQGEAYIDRSLELAPTGSGALDGLTFAVKDVFDIAGHVSSAGNPDWLRTHGPAASNAAVVEQLLAAGASLRGMTITDEVMYSINGENAHYGTPLNPAAPGRIPGGSSSGSASAVAQGFADLGIGTDTGGSVRVPAAYCGLYGLRPTHGAVDAQGLIPLAPSFDTVGWMAQSANVLRQAGEVLLQGQAAASPGQGFTRLVVAEEMWALADEPTREALSAYLSKLEQLVAESEQVTLAPEGLGEWMAAFRHIQGIEIWQAHEAWITENKPSFGPGIADRFAWAATLRREEHEASYTKREEVRERLISLLGENTLMVAPTVPGIAPLQGLSGEAVERSRVATLQLSCPAGLAGLPQLTVPLTGEAGLPVGLSLIAGPGQDLQLLALAEQLSANA
ncbi:amidase [Paenibacillus daejeonensis]|uniref:amidase n=1 Tax=Paenibacillus daejeonensis TaxID=135193 RepID=UPI00037CFEFC|nr:amidase [Paenibacillus daejeonensis]